MTRFTVIGGKGFIGSEVCKVLSAKGMNVYIPEKNSPSLFEEDLGVVIYCAGNGDCAKNPLKVLDSNTTLLATLLEKAKFSRLVYLSSTRLYIDQETARESDKLTISPDDPRRLFNLTKLVAEELCLKSNKNIVILRPSNVYGPAINSPLFLPMIVKHALLEKQINMYVEPKYAKDYLSVTDLAHAISDFATRSEWNGVEIFNVAAGVNVSAEAIAEVIQSKTNCKVNWHKGYVGEKFPVTSIEKIKTQMVWTPSYVLDDLGKMIDEFSILLNVKI